MNDDRRPQHMRLYAVLTLLALVLVVYVAIILCSDGRAPNPGVATPSSMQGAYIDLDGHRIHYVAVGGGPPVVLVHGFGAWGFTWRNNIEALSEHHTVYAIDLLGFGLSDKPAAGPYSVEAQADLVADFIRQLGLRRTTLVGNSLGGEVAIQTTLRYPQLVSSLVLIDSTGFRSGPSIPKWAPKPLLRAALRLILANRFQVSYTLQLAYFDNRLINKNIIDGYYLPVTTRGVPDALTAMARQLKIGSVQKRIARIDKPTLIIWGEKDRILPVADAYKFRRALRNSKLAVVRNSGHAPQEENPETVNRLISRFLAGQNASHRARSR